MTIVNVGLPAIQTDLTATFSQLQWIADAFALALAALLLSGGLIGDRFGRKRVYLGGVGLFLAGSALCAGAPVIGVLVAGRVVQGVAAAFMLPGALSIIARSTTDRVRRASLLGYYGMVASLAVVAGPLLGGLLVDTLGWRSIFLVNLPVGLVVVLLGMRGLTESADPEHAHPDVPGQLLAILFLGSLVFATIEYREHGWDSPLTWAVLVGSVLSLVGLVLVERRGTHPLLPVPLFHDPRFGVTNLAAAALGFGANGAFFLLSLYLQQVQGYSAVLTGVMFLPMTLAIIPGSYVAGRLTGSHGAWLPMSLGFTCVGVALLGMLAFDDDSSYLPIAALFALSGLGQGLGISPATAAVLEIVPRERAGIGSATVSAARQSGTALGIAVLGAFTSQHSFVPGMHRAMVVGAVVVLVAAVLLALTIGKRLGRAGATAG